MAAVVEFYNVFIPKINLLKMRLCDAFVEKLRGGHMLPEKVLLRNRGGERFWVEVLREGGQVYFGDGWVEFVEKNELRNGYVLIFRYDGVRTFDVKIYDHSCCELEFVEDHDDVTDEDEEDEEAEDSSDEDFVSPDPVQNVPKRGSGRRGQECSKRPYRKHDWKDSEAELLVKPDSLYFVAENGLRKRKNQLQVTSSILRDFNVELDEKIIYRDPNGRMYVGKVSRWKTRQVWISAWGTFCKRNHVKETDKCVFELEIDEGRKCSSMLVHIIRKPCTCIDQEPARYRYLAAKTVIE